MTQQEQKENGAKGGRNRARNRKLTDDQVREIRKLLRENFLSRDAIGRKFGVAGSTIRYIDYGVNYADVT